MLSLTLYLDSLHIYGPLFIYVELPVYVKQKNKPKYFAETPKNCQYHSSVLLQKPKHLQKEIKGKIKVILEKFVYPIFPITFRM